MANLEENNNTQINFSVSGQNKPFLTYNGGKGASGAYQAIICQIPPIKVYCEPFLGGGAVFLNLKLPARTVINDYDSCVIEKWQNVRDLKPSCSIDISCKDYRSCIAQINYAGQ